MAKIARTPFNGARWLTKFVTSDTTITRNSTGQCLFVTADSDTVELNINFVDQGSYFKIIIKETTTQDITVTLPDDVAAVIVCDDGTAAMVEGSGTTIFLPTGTTEASYLDLVCDGSKWYCQGMIHGSTAVIS